MALRLSNSVDMLVTGKLGAGKSSLINVIVRKNVAKVGHTLEIGTDTLQALSFKYHNVDITIWDSPGLQDELGKDEEYIRDMYRKGCANSDLVLFCIEMESRVRDFKGAEIKKLTIGLGKQIWNNAVFVMTLANRYVYTILSYECGQKLTPDEDHKRTRDFFKKRLEEWKVKLVGAVVETGVDAKIAANIPIVPAGCHIEHGLPDYDNWLTCFQSIILSRMKRSKSPLLKEFFSQFSKPPNKVTQDNLHKQPHTYDGPTGHILNKSEMKVLCNMMEAYKSEKLIKLKLSIQEAQNQDRVLSREEIEKFLRQNGLTMIADDLKESLKRGVENMHHYESYERALEGALNLTLMYLKFLFLGPPRSGKTSTRKRLIQEIVNLRTLGQPSKSTGVAETNDVILKRLVSEYSAITGSNWQSIMRSNDDESSGQDKKGQDISYLAQLFYQLIVTTPLSPSATAASEVSAGGISVAAATVESIRDPVITDNEHSETNIGSDMTTSRLPRSRNVSLVHGVPKIQPAAVTKTLEETEIDTAFSKLTSILQSDSPKELQQLLQELIMINMVDVGGQPALLEMLPALTIGPALYFLFFRLDQDVKERYPVQFHDPRHEKETVLKSSYCIEDTLYQSLSSIACFSRGSPPDQASSRVLLFGTYKDRVDESRIAQIECDLQESLRNTKIYEEDLLLKTSKGKLFFAVDNMDGDESEIMQIRTDIEEIIKNYFSAIPIPASWLMFRIILHLLKKPTVSLAQCEAIARCLSMPTPVQEALCFFHHKIGSLMYYPEIPSMRDTVICDPQVIFDSISALIIDRFQYSNRKLKTKEIDEFYRNGQFTMSQIKDKTEDYQSIHLSLQQLIEILKHLNVLAEIKNEQENPEFEAACSPVDPSPPKFIMPAVLKQASEEELFTPPSAGLMNLACPLMIHFEGGFVPFGVFCASMAHLIADQDSRWQLCDGNVMKNKVIFNVDRTFYVTLISQLQYIEIQVHQHLRSRAKISLSATLSVVKRTVIKTLQATISKMKYKPYAEALYISTGQSFDLAFACCLGDSHDDHLMKVIQDTDGRYAECLKEGQDTTLKEEHLKWFDEDEGVEGAIHPSSTTEQPGFLTIYDLSKVQNTHAVWEARAQWYNIGLGLALSAGSLDAIKLNNQGQCDPCLREMLSEWLKRRHPRPTWDALAEALRSPSVGYSHLAEELLLNEMIREES